MSLTLIHGPPNSGRAGLIRRRLTEVLDRDPVLVVPTLDDVYDFERELCADGAVLGAAVMTFGALFRAVATAAGAPPGAELTPSQRLGAVEAAVSERLPELGPLRRSASRPGFGRALTRLLDELQEAGLGPRDVEAVAGTLEGSVYLGKVSALFAGYAEVRDRLGRVDPHGIAAGAIALLDRSGDLWKRPVFIYGFDDLTPNQLALIAALSKAAEVTIALPYETGNAALEARTGPLLEALRTLGGNSVDETETEADPGNTDSALLFHLERNFGAADPARRPLDKSLVPMRSAGERGEAEAVAAETAKLLAAGGDPEEIAIVLRDPARRGPLFASLLDAYGVPTALEAEIPVATTAVGGSLIGLLEAMLGRRRAADLLRYLRGPSGVSPQRVDWFERSVRRARAQSATEALSLWRDGVGEEPRDLARVREAAARPHDLAAAVGALAATMAGRLESLAKDGTPTTGADLERRAAAAISAAMSERAALDGLAPPPEALARALGEIRVRAWIGPAEGRVRIVDPYRARAARFDHVFVCSLQDGEFPRAGGETDPFLTEAQRGSLGLRPRRDPEAEERYLFHACLALPRKSLFLSWRDSDENGAAEAPSPFLDDVRGLIDPPPGEVGTDPFEAAARGRELAEVVHRVAEAPSETELARAIAARGVAADPAPLLEAAALAAPVAERITARLSAARRAEIATRAPGPLSNPAVIEELGAVGVYGGTTLEGFDVCSYRWFVSHELAPQQLDPLPDALVQGSIVHDALKDLYRDPPAGTGPGPGTLGAWVERGRELVARRATKEGLGEHPAERAMLARMQGLLSRFLADEAERQGDAFEPWLLEAGFSDSDDAERPALDLGGWRLHGAIDRVDRAPDGRALILDYKLSRAVTPRGKLEEDAKLQLQLYMIVAAELLGVEAIGGLYHPLRGTSDRKPRGAVLQEAAEDLPGRGIVRTDLVDDAGLEELLAEARDRSGEIVTRMREGEIRRDPGPRRGLRGHGICPPFCDFAPICRRDRAPVEGSEEDEEES